VLARGTDILAKAVAEHSAVPAFATYNLEMVQAVVAAAEQTGRPVIILAGSSHFNHAGRSALISIALQAAGDSSATIGVPSTTAATWPRSSSACRPATAR
jgi:tagatose 1,6-diphosphate aldolase GatY/KbaY